MPRSDAGFTPEQAQQSKALGQAVRAARASKSWTQEDLSEAAAMDRSYLADIEAGRRNPTLFVIHRLAAALGVGPADLLR